MIDGKPKWCVIKFGSRVLRDAETRWPAAKLEMLAIVYFVQHFSTYLLPRPFTVLTDSQACSWLNQSSMTSDLAIRWMQILNEYPMTVIHRRRELNANADGVSKRTQDQERAARLKKPVPAISFLTEAQIRELPVLTPEEMRI